jgi:hypothetical protein
LEAIFTNVGLAPDAHACGRYSCVWKGDLHRPREERLGLGLGLRYLLLKTLRKFVQRLQPA